MRLLLPFCLAWSTIADDIFGSGGFTVLDGDENITICDLCGNLVNSTVKDEEIPFIVPNDELSTALSSTVATCGQWTNETEVGIAVDCDDLIRLLERQCCTGIPLLYECETELRTTLLDRRLDPSSVPLTTRSFMTVEVRLEVVDFAISNHGVGGGAIDAIGNLQLKWVDNRLAWNEEEFCADSVRLEPRSQIWVPQLGDESMTTSLPARVLSDGSILWRRTGMFTLHCTGSTGSLLKQCSIPLIGGAVDQDKVRFATTGVLLSDGAKVPEYSMFDNSESASSEMENGIMFSLLLAPVKRQCSVCTTTTAIVQNATIENFSQPWMDRFPSISAKTCSELDDFLQSELNVTDDFCFSARTELEERCCLETKSTLECERSVHDTLSVDNTVTPPDPAPVPGDEIFSSTTMVDVRVHLDLVHVLGIDVKSNTIRVLASLELEWYDKQLSWQPFIGGCQRASFRASLDAEQTEIWVPEIELINLVDGVATLPDGLASARFDGFVRWRRTGILEATCELRGIENFPFDQTSCVLKFGGTRDPLFHRVNYRAPKVSDIQYGDTLQDDNWNYQEYKLVREKTKVYEENDTFSGFDNVVINFEFTFKRARTYYVQLFVVLYVIFTYMSFGMLLIDRSIGERLGYGSSILFVLVAQDITLGENTPVTQEFLWIFKFSFGSKIFVIVAILHSLIMLQLWAQYDIVQEERREQTDEEIQDNDMEPAETTSFLDAAQSNLEPNPSTNTVENEENRRSKKDVLMAVCKSSAIYCNQHTVHTLRRADFIASGVLVVIYTIFVIIMFTAGFA